MKVQLFTSKKIALLLIPLFLLFFAVVPVSHALVFESGIPGVGPEGAAGTTTPSLVKYINFLYIFVLGMVGIAAFVSLVIWGTVWVATGIIDKKAMALESIKNTFIGIGIALAAYIILNTINPAFTTLSLPTTKSIIKVGENSSTSVVKNPVLESLCGALTGKKTAADKTACKDLGGCCWETTDLILIEGSPPMFDPKSDQCTPCSK